MPQNHKGPNGNNTGGPGIPGAQHVLEGQEIFRRHELRNNALPQATLHVCCCFTGLGDVGFQALRLKLWGSTAALLNSRNY